MAPNAESQAQIAQPSKYDARYREVMLPVVRVIAKNGGGSGTIIHDVANPAGEHSVYVLTNFHVVEDLIEVKDRWNPMLQKNEKRDIRGTPQVHLFQYRYKSRAIGGTSVDADIVAYDHEEDLALLRLRSETPAPAVAKLLPKGRETDLRVSMPVFAVGAGLLEPPVITQGMLSQFNREIDNKEFWLNTAASIFGNSGGALFLKDTHEFIGVPARIAVVAFGAAVTHLAYAIPITRVYAFLEAQRFRFIFDPAFTEESEAAERERMQREEAEKRADGK